MNFIDRNVSVEQAIIIIIIIIILAKNGVQVNEKEAKNILELLYLVATNYNKSKEKKSSNPKEISNT